MQFDCGPSAKPLPSDSELLKWNSRDILEAYKDAWLWGSRCEGLLQENKKYLTESLADRETIQKDIDSKDKQR